MFEYSGICIRKIEKYDLDLIRSLRNEQSTWTMLSSPGMINSEAQHDWFYELNKSNKYEYYTIFNKQYDFIGIIRTDEIDMLNKSIRVGVDIVPELRGNGFGKSAYTLIKKYFFNYLNMNRIWLEVLETNIVGINLYKKSGFVEEGRLRQAIFRDGKYIDYIIMSILREEYNE